MGRRAKAYEIVHEGGPLRENNGCQGELDLADIGTVLFDMSAIIDGPTLVVDELDAVEPVPGRLGELGIRLIAGKSSKTSTQGEEARVGDT